jgi:hypothetical protein
MDKLCLRQHNISVSAYEECYKNINTCWNSQDDDYTSPAAEFKQCLSQICLKAKDMCDEVTVHHHHHDRGWGLSDDDTTVPYMDDNDITFPLFMAIVGGFGTFAFLIYWKDLCEGRIT